jgi:TonB family protein
LSADFSEWHDEHSLDHRRRLRNSMLVSLAFHGMIFAAFAVAPSRVPVPMPMVLSVDLVSGPPAAPRPKAPAPAKARPAPKPAAPEPPPAPTPIAKAPVQVLPEEAPSRIRKVAPEAPAPKVVPKPEPKARPKPEPELDYDAAMAALDQELGPDETKELLTPRPDPSDAQTSSGETTSAEASSAGVKVSPELAKWTLDTRRRIQSKWVMPANLRNRGLATTLELRLAANGALVGEPQVVTSSGDPYFDDNTVRAMKAAAPLPPPPKAGTITFVFRSEGL